MTAAHLKPLAIVRGKIAEGNFEFVCQSCLSPASPQSRRRIIKMMGITHLCVNTGPPPPQPVRDGKDALCDHC